MYNYTQLRRDAAQLDIDLHDLARHVDLMLPNRYDLSYDLRVIADRVSQIVKEVQLTQGV